VVVAKTYAFSAAPIYLVFRVWWTIYIFVKMNEGTFGILFKYVRKLLSGFLLNQILTYQGWFLVASPWLIFHLWKWRHSLSTILYQTFCLVRFTSTLVKMNGEEGTHTRDLKGDTVAVEASFMMMNQAILMMPKAQVIDSRLQDQASRIQSKIQDSREEIKKQQVETSYRISIKRISQKPNSTVLFYKRIFSNFQSYQSDYSLVTDY